jgi:hypothetical protein
MRNGVRHSPSMTELIIIIQFDTSGRTLLSALNVSGGNNSTNKIEDETNYKKHITVQMTWMTTVYYHLRFTKKI